MNKPGPEKEMRELCWRGRATNADRERLAEWMQAHPEQAVELREELALTRCVVKIKDVPVATNFASRVLAEVKRGVDSRTAVRDGGALQVLFGRWLPRLGFAALVIAGTFGSWHVVQQNQRVKMGESVAMISAAATVPGTEVWEDFEVIRALHTPAADVELLNLLQ